MPRRTGASRPFLGLLLLALLVGSAPGGDEPPIGAGRALAQTSPTPTPRVVNRPAANATPPPAVRRASVTPSPRPTTSAPPPTTPTPAASATPTPPPPPTSAPPTPTAVPPTPTTAPPSPPAPATAPPPPTQAVSPTIAPPAPASPQSVRIAFAAADWAGGYFRGDGRAYGRPWTAVYGAASPYPRAALTFTLDAAPAGPATLVVTGLDDEWAAPNAIALEVNGARVFDGSSPFPNWDGVGDGANAAWTEAVFSIPAGLLRAGRNEIAVANLTPSANFGIPPYVLLANATLEIAAGTLPVPAPPAIVTGAPATVAASDWRGGYYRGDARAYGRPWAAVYGAASAYPRATLAFRLDAAPRGPAVLEVAGLDDELAGPNPIAVAVNGQEIYSGSSPFADWDGVGDGADAAWTRAAFTLPAELLRPGRNEVTIANRSPSANFGIPPYILLADATLTAPGADVTILPRDGR